MKRSSGTVIPSNKPVNHVHVKVHQSRTGLKSMSQLPCVYHLLTTGHYFSLHWHSSIHKISRPIRHLHVLHRVRDAGCRPSIPFDCFPDTTYVEAITYVERSSGNPRKENHLNGQLDLDRLQAAVEGAVARNLRPSFGLWPGCFWRILVIGQMQS